MWAYPTTHPPSTSVDELAIQRTGKIAGNNTVSKGLEQLPISPMQVISSTVPTIQRMGIEEFDKIVETFKNADAIAQIGILQEQMKGRATLAKRFDGFVAKAKKKGISVEELLADQYQEALEKEQRRKQEVQEQKERSIEGKRQVDPLADRLQAQIIEMRQFASLTNVKGINELIKSLEGELKGPIYRMMEGIDEATPERIEGVNNNQDLRNWHNAIAKHQYISTVKGI